MSLVFAPHAEVRPHPEGAARDANRIFGAHAAHLRCCSLRCSLTHLAMRALRYSAAPSSWTTWITEYLGRPSGHTLTLTP
jgi:hypothetical protein